MAYSPIGQAGRLLRSPALRTVADRHGVSPAQVAVAWTLQPGVVSIPKAATVAHVRENAAAASLRLTPEDHATLDAAHPAAAAAHPARDAMTETFMRVLLVLATLLPALPARAEMAEIVVAEQYGVSILPLMVMERQGLADKQARAAGLPGLSVKWVQVAGPSVMNDGLVSGAVQFAAQGAPSLITLWDKTRNNVGVRGGVGDHDVSAPT